MIIRQFVESIYHSTYNHVVFWTKLVDNDAG